MTSEELNHRFTYHPPKEDQPQRYEAIRTAALCFANVINSLAPDSREKSSAFTKIDEAVFHANAAIARNE